MSLFMLNEVNKLSMLRALESGRFLSMSFCSWDLYEYPLVKYDGTVAVQTTQNHMLSLLCFADWPKECHVSRC